MALILLVDSDGDTRDILRVALESRGYDVVDAQDGATGLRIARERVPQVIIGDFPMDVPGESPFAAAVKADPRLGETWLITLTARALDGASAARAVSDAVILKPAEPARVVEAMEHLLSGQRSKASHG